jgi:hypothetical protein
LHLGTSSFHPHNSEAKILVKGMGILHLPNPEPRIPISPGVIDAVRAFYCTDGAS